MIERIEKIEEELNVIRYYFEFAKQYIENEKEKLDAMTIANEAMINFVKDTNEKIIDLQDVYVTSSNLNALTRQQIEIMSNTIKSLIETVGILTNK
jgi:CHAD domain-containing protein